MSNVSISYKIVLWYNKIGKYWKENNRGTGMNKYYHLCMAFLLSVILFYPLNVKYIIYAAVTALIWGMVLSRYKLRKNRQLYLELFWISVGNLLALIAAKGLVHGTLHVDVWNILLCVVYAAFLIFVWCQCRAAGTKEEAESRIPGDRTTKQLFPKRQYDLERIMEYIDTFPIVGVNGAWGTGKSFLMDQLRRHETICANYELIEIDLLSCNLDEIQITLLNEMDRVLRENGIFSRHSMRLKQMLKEEKFLVQLKSLIFAEDMAFSDALRGFKGELQQLDRRILIIYEDIDRITKTDIIQKIFGISEKLSGERIKVLYQYEEQNLRRQGLNRDYLEKYLPYVVNLADIAFDEILEQVMEERSVEPEILKMEDFDFFRYKVYIDHYVAQRLGLPGEYKLPIQDFTVRKVEHFLDELEMALHSNPDYQQKKNKRTVIAFFLLKHFFEPYYEKLKQGECLMDCMTFSYQGESYTLPELLKLRENDEDGKPGLTSEDIRAIFQMKENRDTYGMLGLFDYEYRAYQIERNREEIQNEPIRNIRDNNANDKLNRIIWNLLSNGRSENTDFEENARELIEGVLSKPESEWKEAYGRYAETAHHGTYRKRDNKTLSRFGMRVYTQLFQAFRVYDAGEAEWMGLLRLFFMLEPETFIDIEFIEMINYCDVGKRQVYLEILRCFNRMAVKGNMNDQQCYRTFLKNFLGAIGALGYADCIETWQLEGKGGIENSLEEVQYYMQHCITKLDQSDAELDIEAFHADIRLIKAFVEKNQELIRAKKQLKPAEPQWKTSVSTRWLHQELVDELQNSNLTEEELMAELEKCYREESLNPREIKAVWKKSHEL